MLIVSRGEYTFPVIFFFIQKFERHRNEAAVRYEVGLPKSFASRGFITNFPFASIPVGHQWVSLLGQMMIDDDGETARRCTNEATSQIDRRLFDEPSLFVKIREITLHVSRYHQK